MPSTVPTATHDDLLCERCGYRIQGLPHDGPCPECGRPIRSSLPDARAGSPWQQEGGIGAAIETALGVLKSPRAAFSQISIRGRPDAPLLAGNIAAAAFLIALGTWVAILRDLWMSEGRLDMGSLLGAAAFAIVFGGYGAVIVLHALTAIEHRGIRFFGARRGWRITPSVATSICSHASVGWVIAGAMVLLGVLVGMWSEAAAADCPAWLREALLSAPRTAPAAGFLAGLFVFEMLVYIGVRRCRFANA